VRLLKKKLANEAGVAANVSALHQNLQSSSLPVAPVAEGASGVDLQLLTRRMTKGDEVAWRIFYDRYFDRLWRYLLVCADGNEDLAREALQAALLRVARHAKVFTLEGVFWSWLTVLAHSAFADETKKRRRYFSFLERFQRHTRTQRDAGGEDRLRTLLGRQMASLAPDERQLIEQKYFGGQSVREIALEADATEKAVESRLARIRRKLKEAVLKELADEGQQ
jgi:RNA polymerase sigma-70 factor (ECF subfamily)